MLSRQTLLAEPERVQQALVNRGMPADTLDPILDLAQRRLALLQVDQELRENRNRLSSEIPKASGEARAAMVAEVGGIKAQMATTTADLRVVEEELDLALMSLPNLPDPRVPVGPGEEGNVVIDTDPPGAAMDFAPQAHWDLGPALGLLDFERGVKISGSRFYVLREGLARLQRALIAYLLDVHQANGFRELYLPFVTRQEALRGAGQLPKFADNLYHDVEDDVWLVPTAEVPITAFHAGEIIPAEELPLRYCAYTPCFRREKMSAGRDVRGMKRGHQFDKVELYVLCEHDQAEAEFERILKSARGAAQSLGLRTRIKELCTGDLGFGAQRTYDIETWAPGCGEWLEVSSVSTCGAFQARRSNIKTRAGQDKAHLVTTLNGSGLGIPRTMISIIETWQQADGSIVVPPVLRDRVGTDRIGPAASKA